MVILFHGIKGVIPENAYLLADKNLRRTGLFEEAARIRNESALLPGLPDPFLMDSSLNHVHHLGYVVSERAANAKEFFFLLRSWYSTADVDAGAQDTNPRLQQLKLRVIPRPKPLKSQSQERGKEVVHPLSFRSAKPAQRRENVYGTKADYILVPLAWIPTERDEANMVGGEGAISGTFLSPSLDIPLTCGSMSTWLLYPL